jgi:xanthine/uracil permease
MVPPKKLNKIFPKIVTGSLLLLVGVYLINSGMQNWGGSSNCNGGTGFYALCPNVSAPKPLAWYFNLPPLTLKNIVLTH